MIPIALVVLIVVLGCASLYALGLFRPVARFYQLGFALLRVIGLTLNVAVKSLSSDDLIPKLIFLMLGLLVLSSDVFGTLVSLGILFPEAAQSLPDLGSLLSFALASQFIAPSFLLGAIILEMHGYIHQESARLFVVKKFEGGFRWYVYITLALSILSGCIFYLAKGLFLYMQEVVNDPTNFLTADPTGIMHHLAGFYSLFILLVLTLIGCVTLLTAPLAGYCLVIGLQAFQRLLVLLATACVSCGTLLVATCQEFFFPDTIPPSVKAHTTLTEVSHVLEKAEITLLVGNGGESPSLPAPGDPKQSEAAGDGSANTPSLPNESKTSPKRDGLSRFVHFEIGKKVLPANAVQTNADSSKEPLEKPVKKTSSRKAKTATHDGAGVNGHEKASVATVKKQVSRRNRKKTGN